MAEKRSGKVREGRKPDRVGKYEVWRRKNEAIEKR
jgi:hypothetical protein